MKVGIHHRPGSFSDRWLEYCREKGIEHGLCDCYASRIVEAASGYDLLLWHWHHEDSRAVLFARQLMTALGYRGIRVFPNPATCWHFDDKLGQKYLLEAVGAPLVPTYVFYDRTDALAWIRSATFPKVFKLRNGAGSFNVRLVSDRREAVRLCGQAFGAGFVREPGYFADFSTKAAKARQRGDLGAKLRRFPRVMWARWRQRWRTPRERGYLYFQDFVAGNPGDTRITVIGNRAFGFRRKVRPGDFRASGSGQINYDTSGIDQRCLRVAFDVAARIQAQSVAFDFLHGEGGQALIVEISYAYVPEAVHACPGHWDSDLRFHEGHLFPQDAILEDLLCGETQ